MIFSIFAVMAPLISGEMSNVSSNQASYEDEHLVLQGDVHVDHPLAKMSAEKAILDRKECGDMPFSEVKLTDHVQLRLKKSGEIQCDLAFFDFEALTGQLRSLTEKVMYVDLLKTKRGQEPLRILGDSVDVDIEKENEGALSISKLIAKNDVILDFANAFTLLADKAVYDGKLALATGQEGADPQARTCKLEHQKDLVLASQIALNLKESLLSLKNAKGSLSFPGSTADLQFICANLLWDHLKKTLSLQGDAEVVDLQMGSIESSSSIELVKQENEKAIKTLFSPGNVTFTYTPVAKANSHTLHCPGPFLLDREKLKATFEKGKEQVQYEEQQFSFSADNAEIDYTQEGDQLRPLSVSLKGNVKLLSQENESDAKCGACDKLTFFPATRTLILTAEAGKKVLFFNQADKTQISAREVQITQNESDEKPTVKGIGNVQFSFSAEEFSFLKSLFPLSFS